MPATIVREPRVDERPEQLTMGIRIQTPMTGMSKEATRLFKEIFAWAEKNDVEEAGAPFLRLHVIDMKGEMDIEVGIPVKQHVPGDERVKPGVLPAGRYANLVYTGPGIAGNKVLILWARANGLEWDRWDDPKGDGFRSRYESYLTDPKIEPRKTKWEVEVAIKLAD
jgi:effector-binding domain-containing protein